jgi:mono/diheme cytochrome c family protein
MTLPQATVAADVHHGETIAKRWCAACHIVSREQSHGSAAAPPFSAIAKRSGFDDAKLALFLLAPHPKMPDMTLSRVEAADLAAYIVSQ